MTQGNIETDICLVIEGSYPFVTGGVATWTQRLCEYFNKEFTFSIFALTAGDKTDDEMRYTLPENVKECRHYNLFDNSELKAAKPVNFDKNELLWNYDVIRTLISSHGDRILKPEEVYLLEEIIENYQAGFFKHFMTTESGFKFITELYGKTFGDYGFLKYYYNWRDIYLVFSRTILLMDKMPKAKIYHSVTTGFAGLLACLQTALYNKKSIITEHGIYVQERTFELSESEWLKDFYLRKMWIDFYKVTSRWQYRTVDKLVTIFYGNKLLEKEYGADEERIQVISNGINPERFSPAIRKRAIEKPYHLGLVGRVDPIKDVKTFINAIAIIKTLIPEIKAWICGPIEEDQRVYYNECLSMVEMLELEDIITFTGPVNVIDYYRKFDVLLLTSVKEAMPLVVMEAMASGLPVVATNVGACSELLNGIPTIEKASALGNVAAGEIATVLDAYDLAVKTVRILNNPALANRMSNIGIRRIKQFYTSQMVKDEYEKIYTSLLEDKQTEEIPDLDSIIATLKS